MCILDKTTKKTAVFTRARWASFLLYVDQIDNQLVRFSHGTRYATVCVRLLWLTPSRGTSIMTVCTGVSCLLQTYCLVADVTDLAHSCDDPTSHDRRSRGLVGCQSLAYHLSGIKREVGPCTCFSSPSSSCRETSLRLDAVRVCEFSGAAFCTRI